MKTWIALLRGINVVGKNKLPMKTLAALMEKSGCRDVVTYIQSGNVVFRSPLSDAAALAARIEKAVSAACGFSPRVLVLDRGALKKAMAANPFPEAEENHAAVHLFFLARTPKEPDIASLNAYKANGEAFALKGRVFYLHTPAGFGPSKLARRIERDLGVDATARNWRTVCTLLDLSADRKDA
jgi:uncharacterized protein (DUF1697 family)